MSDDRNSAFLSAYAPHGSPVKLATRRVVATLVIIASLLAVVFGLSTALYGSGIETAMGFALVLLGIVGIFGGIWKGKLFPRF